MAKSDKRNRGRRGDRRSRREFRVAEHHEGVMSRAAKLADIHKTEALKSLRDEVDIVDLRPAHLSV